MNLGAHIWGLEMLLKFLSAKFLMIHTPKPLSDSGKGSGDKKKIETEYLTWATEIYHVLSGARSSHSPTLKTPQKFIKNISAWSMLFFKKDKSVSKQ
jgi:hypothetical protein